MTSQEYCIAPPSLFRKSPPRIVCAACKWDAACTPSIVIPSARHFDGRMHALVEALGLQSREETQGFIDQHGTFYNRKDAWLIAEANGQIVKRVGGDGLHRAGLFSENLY